MLSSVSLSTFDCLYSYSLPPLQEKHCRNIPEIFKKCYADTPECEDELFLQLYFCSSLALFNFEIKMRGTLPPTAHIYICQRMISVIT